MNRLVFYLVIAGTCVLVSPRSIVHANDTQPLVVADRPTIVAFFPPTTDAELKKDFDTNAALDDFRFYATRVRAPLKSAGIEFHEIYAHSFLIRVGKTVISVRPEKVNAGYYFVVPGNAPRIEYGVMTDADLLQMAAEYFGIPVKGSDQPKNAKGSVCWPLHFAGVTVGVTTDSQVQRLIGQGVFRPDEGHTGGRYFLDLKQTATLHIVDGVDGVVEELTLSEGANTDLRLGAHNAAMSQWFDPQEGFGNWHALHLGSLRKDVLTNLGNPEGESDADHWRYQTTCACELPAYLTVSFASDHVVQIQLSMDE